MSAPIRTRIAPTPSGYLHMGNAFNFLLTEAIARRGGGTIRLRIDDLDAPRVRDAYIADLFESLGWLGIKWEEGPADAAEQAALFTQRLRMQDYNGMLQALRDTGLVFACNCSRKALQQSSPDGQYSGACLDKGLPLDSSDLAWRIRTPAEEVVMFNDALLGRQEHRLWTAQRHFIIRRRDGLPAYQVASLSDDARFGINTIVRGEDLLSSTIAQLYLAGLLGLERFTGAVFYHHPLLRDAQGEKLSKSAGSTSLRALRNSKMRAEDLRALAKAWYEPLLQGSHAG